MKKAGTLLFAFLISACLTALLSCERSGEEEPGSFQLIQTKIFNTSCAMDGCHRSNSDPSFVQHGLVLDQSVSYSQLVNRLPENELASSDGLLRVKPFSADKSLLFHKIHSNADLHHSEDYGLPMPLGLPLLSLGQVEFIRRWIEAGAPRTGQVVDDLSLLDDETPQAENFTPLNPPSSGFQLKIGPFEVAPNFEREFFIYKSLGNAQDIYVNRIEIKMRQNSHHFLIQDFSDEISTRPPLDEMRDIRNLSGSMNTSNMVYMLYHRHIAGSQSPYVNITFPEGIGLHFAAGTALDFNSHYVNKQTVPIEGEVYVNFHTVDQSTVQKIARPLQMANNAIILPPRQRTTLTKTFLVERSIRIFALTSHTHQLGEKFIIKIAGGVRNGEVIYTSTNWQHPAVVNFQTPIVLNAGEGLISEITYNNTRDKHIYFGLTSDDEMGIIFGYYTEE
jgi:hypothetical protein